MFFYLYIRPPYIQTFIHHITLYVYTHVYVHPKFSIFDYKRFPIAFPFARMPGGKFSIFHVHWCVCLPQRVPYIMNHLLDSQMRRILCSCLHVHRVRIAGGIQPQQQENFYRSISILLIKKRLS